MLDTIVKFAQSMLLILTATTSLKLVPEIVRVEPLETELGLRLVMLGTGT